GEADGEARLSELLDEAGEELGDGLARCPLGQEVGHPLAAAALLTGLCSCSSSRTALAMSLWYLSRMLMVAFAVSASTCSTPSSSSVSAQSIVSDTDGDFFSSSWRIERTMRAT